MCYSIYVHSDLKKFGPLNLRLELALEASVCGECLTGDDSIAYDCSFDRAPQKSELNCCTAVHCLIVFLSGASCAKKQY